jgi:prepilin-type N-terminal cleavage/methylation domain-containing protein
MAMIRPQRSSAFSLVELIVSMAILALLLVGAVSMGRAVDARKSNVAAERFAACIEQARHTAISRRKDVLVSIRDLSGKQMTLGQWETGDGSEPKPIGRERELPQGVDFSSADLTKQEFPCSGGQSDAWVLKVDRHGRLVLPEGSGLVTVSLRSNEESKPRVLRIARSTARVLNF